MSDKRTEGSAIQNLDQVDAFKSELRRTGISFSDLSGILTRKMKRPVKAPFLRRLAQGNEKDLKPETWTKILDTMSALPKAAYKEDASKIARGGATYSKQTRIEIDNEKRGHLNAELERTGAVMRDVGIRVFPERQKVRSEQIVFRWRTGRVRSAPKKDWDRVIAYLQRLPDKTETYPSPKRRTLPPAKPPPKRRYTVKRPDAPERRAVLSNTNDDKPAPDLRHEEIEPPRKRSGVETYTLRRQHEALGYMVITEELYQRLHAERQRTLVSARRLVASSEDAPRGLRSRDIDFWLLGKILAAECRYLEWTFEAYSRLPDAPANPQKNR